jgi:hypothetical protein
MSSKLCLRATCATTSTLAQTEPRHRCRAWQLCEPRRCQGSAFASIDADAQLVQAPAIGIDTICHRHVHSSKRTFIDDRSMTECTCHHDMYMMMTCRSTCTFIDLSSTRTFIETCRFGIDACPPASTHATACQSRASLQAQHSRTQAFHPVNTSPCPCLPPPESIPMSRKSDCGQNRFWNPRSPQSGCRLA